MPRVRHYTRKSSKDKILEDGMIVAKVQNKVFVEYANHDPYSPQDAEHRYKLKPGKGNAYIEFDMDNAELEEQPNSLTCRRELFVRGDVDLSTRGPEGFDNL